MTSIKNYFSYKSPQLVYMAVLLIFLLSDVTIGQKTNTNQGKDFWFGYLNTVDGNSVSEVVNITSTVNTSGTISIPGSAYTHPFTVTAGLLTRVVLPSTDVVQTSGFGVPVNKAVNVTANDNISVHASIETDARSENTCILPVPLLGNHYYVMDYDLANGAYTATSEFMVVAQSCKDSVEIIPSQGLSSGQSAGTPFTIVLQPGEIFQVQSGGDLTGSEIISLNHAETAVFSGETYTTVQGIGGCTGSSGNPLYEQMFPINTWGENYVFVATPNAVDQCRVLAETNNTTVTFYTGSYTSTQSLSAGQYFDTAIVSSLPVFISATNPISVGRVLVTQLCNQTSPSLGDPSFTMVDANEQMLLNSITFYTSTAPDIDTNYLQVITLTANTGTIFFDGQNIGSLFTPVGVGPTPYSYAALGLTTGSHQLTGNSFLAYATGFGSDVDATACDAGVYLKEINLATSTTAPTTCSSNNGTATAIASGIPGFSYLWSNGQTTSTATGLSGGVYTVIVKDSDCVPHVDSATVFIPGNGAKVTISATSDSICPGNFTTLSIIGGTSYLWNNSSSSTTSSITVSPASTATYSAVVGNGACPSIDASFIVTVNSSGTAPVASFTTTGTCGGGAVQFNNTSNPLNGKGVLFYWDFYGNGHYEDSTITNPSWLYKDTGTYHVRLHEVNNGDCGGSSDYTLAVVISNSSTVIKYSDFPGCAGQPSSFFNNTSDTGSVKYLWTFGDPASGTADTSTIAHTTHIYQDTGMYTITLWPLHPTPCHDSVTTTVHIIPSPLPSIQNNYVCGDSTVTFWDKDSSIAFQNQLYSWTIYDVTVGPPSLYQISSFSQIYQASASLTFPADTGTYIIIEETENANLCTAYDTTYLTLKTPNPKINGKNSICLGQSVLLIASGGTPYIWSATSKNSTTDTVTVMPTQQTVYSVTADTGVCQGIATFTVAVNPNPTAKINTIQENCNSNQVTLKATGGGTYHWSNNATTDSINIILPNQFVGGGGYTVTVTNAYGCSASASINLNTSNPSLKACCDTTIQSGAPVILKAIGRGIAKYTWTSFPASIIICPTCANITVDPTVTTTYTITGIDSLGCPLDTVIVVKVETPCLDLTIPNVFTPNYAGVSGVDNVFYVKAPANTSTWSLTIYDRWGKEMFKTTDPANYWKGTTEGGSDAPEGVYYYIVTATCDKTTMKKDGFIQLIR